MITGTAAPERLLKKALSKKPVHESLEDYLDRLAVQLAALAGPSTPSWMVSPSPRSPIQANDQMTAKRAPSLPEIPLNNHDANSDQLGPTLISAPQAIAAPRAAPRPSTSSLLSEMLHAQNMLHSEPALPRESLVLSPPPYDESASPPSSSPSLRNESASAAALPPAALCPSLAPHSPSPRSSSPPHLSPDSASPGGSLLHLSRNEGGSPSPTHQLAHLRSDINFILDVSDALNRSLETLSMVQTRTQGTERNQIERIFNIFSFTLREVLRLVEIGNVYLQMWIDLGSMYAGSVVYRILRIHPLLAGVIPIIISPFLSLHTITLFYVCLLYIQEAIVMATETDPDLTIA